MTPMCSSTTGKTIGWAVANVNCEGTSVSILYYSTNGTLVGTTKPDEWEYCRPGFSNDTIYSIIVLTQTEYDSLTSPDPSVLYMIIPD